MRSVVAIVLLSCTACSSGAVRDERRPLPLHIALAPLVEDDVREDRKSGDEGQDTTMRLEFDPAALDRVSRRVADALGARTFAHVSLLHAGAGSSSAFERDKNWLSAAREAHADLLLRLEVSTQPVIRQRKNPVFWLNLPLFLLGGPFGWWLSDRAYFADVEIAAWFYDPRGLPRASLESPLRATRGEVASLARRTERMDLAFVDRAQGNLGRFALSMIWPCGFLAVESGQLERELADRLIDQLGTGLALATLDQSAVLERGVHPFFLDFKRSGIELDGRRRARLRATVLLAAGREIETMRNWSVHVPDRSVLSGSFDAEPPLVSEGAFRRYEFMVELGELRPGTLVRLDLEAGERDPRVRTYTFRVPEPLGP